jgi:hypothetical protein
MTYIYYNIHYKSILTLARLGRACVKSNSNIMIGVVDSWL